MLLDNETKNSNKLNLKEEYLFEIQTPKEIYRGEQKLKSLKSKNFLPGIPYTPIACKRENSKETSCTARKRLLLQDNHLEEGKCLPPAKIPRKDNFQHDSQNNKSISTEASKLFSNEGNAYSYDQSSKEIPILKEKIRDIIDKKLDLSENSSKSYENQKKLSLEEMRLQLSKCSKLIDVQKCLLSNYSPKKLQNDDGDLLKDKTSNKDIIPIIKTPRKNETCLSRADKLNLLKKTASKIKLQTTKLKETQSKISNTPETGQIPAYQKYHTLATVSTPSLVLPYKYKILVDIFHCTDMVVSLLHNRQETCTFSKLKNSVQEMTKKNFTISHLGQLKTVFPYAYIFQQDKDRNNNNSEKSHNSSYHLTISPNFQYKEQYNSNGFIESPQSFQIMNATCLLERRNIFYDNILHIVKMHHESFLENLNPPILVSKNQIACWHPSFPIDQVPDIAISSLPEPPDMKKYSTAQDVFKLIKDKVTERVGNALQCVIEKHKDLDSVTNSKDIMQTGVLKGVSQALIDKIRAREAARIKKMITRNPDEERKIEMLTRLPEMINILRNYFITERKAALSIEEASKKLSDSYHCPISIEDIEQHLQLMVESLPEWITIITIRKGSYIKIDKNKNINIIKEKINNLIKMENC